MRIGIVIDHDKALAAYQAAGHPFPAIPEGKNTVWHHFDDIDGNQCVILNQSGCVPVASDNEQQINGCSLLVAIDPSDAETARCALERAVRKLLALDQ